MPSHTNFIQIVQKPLFSLRTGGLQSKALFFGHVSDGFLTSVAKVHLLQCFRKTDKIKEQDKKTEHA